MKLLFSISIFSLFFTSCQTSTTETTIVSGKVNIKWSEQANLRNGTISLAESWSNQIDHRDSLINLNKDGSFHVNLDIEKSKLYSFSHQNKKVEFILNPGDSIHINFKSDTIFSGSFALENNHLVKMNREIEKNHKFITKDEASFFSKSIISYKAVIDSLELGYLNTHKKFKEKYNLANYIDVKVKNDITYKTKFYKIIHPSIYEMYTNDTLEIDQRYFDKISKGSFKNPQLLNSKYYVSFLERYVNIMAAGNLRFRNFYDAGIPKIQPKYNAIKDLDANQDIKDYLMNEHLKKSISNYGIAYLNDIIADYEKECKDEMLRDQIVTLYEESKARRNEPDTIKIYKKINNIELEAHIFYPKNHSKEDKKSVYAFFHGGGWASGIPEWGYKNCKRYQEKGMVAISFEYRLIDIHSSNIIDCIKDVNSAILWIKQQANELGIDPNKVVAAGFSAGGHLASSTVMIEEFNISDSKFDSKPNALVIQSASYNTSKSNFFRRQADGNATRISTFHNVKKGTPPAIFFHGTNDHLAPITEFTEFRDKMEDLGNDFEYKIFQNVGHFFGDAKANEEVRVLTDKFLKKQGYIE